MSENKGLGSLAQSTRGNDLNKTRNILIVIGLLTLAINGFMFGNAMDEVRQAGIAPEDEARVLGLVRLIYGAGIAVGLAFVICGVLVKKFPVPLTILSLVLYVGANAGFAFLDPTILMQGLVVKIIVVVALAKSVQTAMAYQKDRDAGLTE